MSGRTFKIFVDFDGTITKQDIGESMFLKFGSPVKAQTIIDDWINKKIKAKLAIIMRYYRKLRQDCFRPVLKFYSN